MNSKTFVVIKDALDLIKENSKEKFDASIEVHLKLGIDPKKGEQQVRGSVSLPHGTGKDIKVAIFTQDIAGVKKEVDGIDGILVCGEDFISEIKKTSKLNFDVAVSTPDMMPKLAQIAKILGPRGIMPSPKSGTVTSNVSKVAKELQAGKITFKNDDTANLHTIIGKKSFDTVKLVENFEALLSEINRIKPTGARGTYLKGAFVSSTMGKSIAVSI